MVGIPHGDGGDGPDGPLRPPGRAGERVPALARRGRGRPRAAALSGPAAVGLGGLLLAVGLAFAGRGFHGLAAVGAEAAAAAATTFLAWRRLGGFTGDVLGAAAVVGETAGLLALAWR